MLHQQFVQAHVKQYVRCCQIPKKIQAMILMNAAANQACDNQRGPALQQMATAYGLLPQGQQAAGQGSSGSAPSTQQPQPWSWGQASPQAGQWGMEGHAEKHTHARHLQSHRTTTHSDNDATHVEAFETGASSARHDSTFEQMPDALAHLLSAAEAASSARK